LPANVNPVMYSIIEEELPSLKVEYGNSTFITKDLPDIVILQTFENHK
jgi:hypothetical protein